MPEIERRWLVDPTAVGDFAQAPCRRYEDLYLDGSRLRLRKITDANGTELYKLGKKYGKQTALSEPITTLYLSALEYGLFWRLPGRAAIKRRYAIEGGSLDVYEQPLPGFMVFELEFASEPSARGYEPPSFVTQEITGDAAYSGFALAGGRCT